jgi:hypothetical protein
MTVGVRLYTRLAASGDLPRACSHESRRLPRASSELPLWLFQNIALCSFVAPCDLRSSP